VSARQVQEISISVSTLDQLFNAPTVNPFSEKEVEARGESGMSYFLRLLQGHRQDWRDLRLIVRLPPDQITADLQPLLSQAVRRYCQTRIESNMLDVHMIRVRSSVGLGILLAIVVALIAVVYILFTQVAPDTPEAVQYAVVATLSLFAWVSLWDPLEALLFNPLEPMRESRLLRRIMELNILVEPDTNVRVSPGPRLSNASAQPHPTEA
jgi:hypothetical protein